MVSSKDKGLICQPYLSTEQQSIVKKHNRYIKKNKKIAYVINIDYYINQNKVLEPIIALVLYV